MADLGPALFSAYAEVFPRYSGESAQNFPFLCLRRGVSFARVSCPSGGLFSLPTQRCFPRISSSWRGCLLFSAYAEVFLHRPCCCRGNEPFLCLRRGVSRKRKRDKSIAYFSLPTQRCFPNLRTEQVMAELFSAYAEVFPSLTANSSIRAAFLCLRRGVSHPYRPKTRRPKLFSAYAEVFLS